MLTAFASVLLAIRIVKRAAPALVTPGANGTAMLLAAAPAAPTRRRGKRWQYALTMGRMGTSSSFVLRTPRRSIKKQAAKAAMRTVVLIGSHFGAGNDLLKHVFGELVREPPAQTRAPRGLTRRVCPALPLTELPLRLTYSFAQCQRSRLALRCESTWGGQHDLKSLASFKGRNKRLVWLESDAESLLRTLRNLRAHALDYRLVHVLWDPMQVRGRHRHDTAHVAKPVACAGSYRL